MTEPETSSRSYEIWMSTLIIIILLIGVVWNMPTSAVKRTVQPLLTPIALGTGLDQGWQMYAPNPIRQLETVEVHVTMADGSDRMWTNPRGDVVVGPFAWYRWQKLKENLVREPDLREGVAHWAVRKLTAPTELPTRVTMTLYTQELATPGAEQPQHTGVETLYEQDLFGRP